MTEAEKMAEEWSERFNFEYPLTQKLQLKQLIHQVAERTRETCLAAYYICGPDIAIRNARWEDKEV